MDRWEFAASLSEEQEEFIANRIDAYLQLVNRCMDEYKNNPSEEFIRRIESNLACADCLNILSNQDLTSVHMKIHEDFATLKDSHQKNMALVNRNKKLEKTLMIKVLAKAGELLELTYAALTLGFGAVVGLFVLNQLCKMLGV